MAPDAVDHSFEIDPQDAVRSGREHHIRVSVELAGFPPETADVFIDRGFDPQTVARLLKRALSMEQ
jgi:hypothetical protein